MSAPRLPVLAVTHIAHSHPNSFERLACGVFRQALRDAGLLGNRLSGRIDRKMQRDAVDFLTNGGEAFRFWCHALDQNPETVQSVLKKRLTRG